MRRKVTNCEASGTCAQVSWHLWGQYSPYFPVKSEIDAGIPDGCAVTFAQVLARHGARSPTLHKSEAYNETIHRIKSAVSKYGKGYEFIRNYDYTLGADNLVPFGRMQMETAGSAFYGRYRDLARTASPFVRASGQERVIESAVAWTKAFLETQGADPDGQHAKEGNKGDSDPASSILVIPETEGSNNTLNHGLCLAFETGDYSHNGLDAQAVWAAVFVPPIVKRLNRKLPGANITTEEAIYLMDLCPFNVVANPKTPSGFCNLFTVDEWRGYDYYQSLGKYYGFSSGNPLGPSQGVGFVNELLARLTDRPVDDHTSSNTTLDASPDTFPLGRGVYADFSHDNSMSSIFGALGLYNATKPLPKGAPRSPQQTGGYSAAWTVPFAGRMYVEKMRCGADAGADKSGQELVRILINDRVVPLQNCGADELGRCTLDKFVESMAFARGGGRWGECFQS